MNYSKMLLTIAAVMTAVSGAHAQTLEKQSIAEAQEVSAPQVAAPLTKAKVPNASPMLSLEDLNELRGGTQIAINTQTLTSTNTGNVIGGDFDAGDVSLSDNAFSNFNGLGNFVFNTGAQSSLQAGLTVTLNVSE